MDMTVMLKRKNIYFRPYLDRVLARRFDLGDERSVKIMQRVLALAESDKKELLSQVLRNYARTSPKHSQCFRTKLRTKRTSSTKVTDHQERS